MSYKEKLNRRTALKVAGASILLVGCEKQASSTAGATSSRASADEEYVWLSANANLPLFTAHDHPALRLAGQELGVKVTVAGPNSIDIPGFVAAIEQTIARKPAGMMERPSRIRSMSTTTSAGVW